MTDHLPECHLSYRCHGLTGITGSHATKMDFCTACHRVCICPELRACERRVAEETEAAMIEFFYWKPSPPHDQHYFADNICAYCVGYREAFTAARKSVAALPQYAMRDTCVSAIDELREEKQ